MDQLLIIVLVCASTLSPAECTPDNALDVMAQPSASPIPTACLEEGQVIVAGGGIGRRLDADSYMKVACQRRR